MDIICRTNIDQYREHCFPELTVVPRIGETVRVKDSYESHFISRGVPTKLEVVNIEYGTGVVMVELHYRAIDIERHKIEGTIEKLYQ
jgi:hypothetical protein